MYASVYFVWTLLLAVQVRCASLVLRTDARLCRATAEQPWMAHWFKFASLYSQRAANAIGVWHCVLCCAMRNARGATLLASLTSELADSASLRYLRRHSQSEWRAQVSKSFLLRQKRKIRNTEIGIPYLWRRRKDLNLRAGYPTYTLSRGASSPLEYFSIEQAVVFISLPNYYINYFEVCQYLFWK